MPHLHKPANGSQVGYDGDRNLQVMSVNKQTTFYLVAGAGLKVFAEPEAIVVASSGSSDNAAAHKDKSLSEWEDDQVIRVITLTSRAPGTAQLRATLDGYDWIAPLTVRVIDDATCRQVGKSKAQVTPELASELRRLSLRDAVIRVAEDQMHSAVAQTDGFGVYNMSDDLDWCGGFAYWCWDQACAIRGEPNPLGGSNTVLWSPQRAIHWGMKPETPAQLLRYEGTSPMDGKGKQEYREIGYNGHDLRPADIVLVRDGTASGWKHVCMIHQVQGRTLETIDGNQGKKGTSGVSIKLRQRSLDAEVQGGDYALVILALDAG